MQGRGPGAAPRPDQSLAAEARLRRVLAVNRRLNSELSPERILEELIDTAIEILGAERGFLLLSRGGVLEIQVARNIARADLGGEELALSRSIAERAASGGAPIVAVDAELDERWAGARSVAALHLRSVLAVPLSVRGRLVGALYVDHRLRKGAFRDDDVQLVLDIADQAALALAHAEHAREADSQRRELAELNRRLEAELERQAVELSSMRVELSASRDDFTSRYDYSSLIGASPALRELKRVLDRATASDVPVLIQGESGTGKELVARALHANGPRRGAAFVAANCGAITETLLESELFGVVRGAYTGADRERRGLFEVADGGTLLLDEIGEMSPQLQTKLLRVLQDGEVRRVGAERGRHVDVRIVAASNKDLARLVEDGHFRADLFYRVNVVRIDVPALRERLEDVPLLCEHFLRKHAGDGPPRRLARDALRRLAAYHWPGNVRELENELRRAAVMASGELISAADLSPRIIAGPGGAEGEGDAAEGDLAVRPRVERLEKTLLREALRRAHNNQTQAARLLGLSRFGLQKKLRRLAGETDEA